MDNTLTRTEWRRDGSLAPDLRPMFNAAVVALDMFAIVFLALMSTTVETWWLWALMLATTIGAIAFLLYFTGLLWAQARLGIREYTSETPVVPETGRAMRIMAADPGNPRSYTVAKYALSEGQMRRLANALAREGWAMKRDAVRAARVLPTADMEQWRDVVLAEFERAGIIDATAAVTTRGRELFEPYVTPAPARFEATFNPPPVRRQSDGAARGGCQGGVGG